MKGTVTNPVYTAYIVTASGTRYQLDEAKTNMTLTQGEKNLAAQVDITLCNAKVNGTLLSEQIRVKDRIYMYADSGEGAQEVFCGFIWEKGCKSDVEKEITLTCYDNLIYLENSKDNFYFTKGQQTSGILAAVASKWGIQLIFEYESITHPKTNFRGERISDIFIGLLDEVKKETGIKYVVCSEKDIVYIKKTGINKIVYQLERKKNALSADRKTSLSGVVTKVIITGNQDDEERAPILATVEGDITQYGTLQDIISKDKDTSLEDAQKEAEQLLKDKGSPAEQLDIRAVDIPWVKKGDLVKLTTDLLDGDFIVKSTEHDISQKIMTLELERAE